MFFFIYLPNEMNKNSWNSNISVIRPNKVKKYLTTTNNVRENEEKGLKWSFTMSFLEQSLQNSEQQVSVRCWE